MLRIQQKVGSRVLPYIASKTSKRTAKASLKLSQVQLTDLNRRNIKAPEVVNVTNNTKKMAWEPDNGNLSCYMTFNYGMLC